ncbi:hypothetical protein ANTQUA_LOCUS5830 [Anthophora quadrimaculata]
MKNLGSRWTVPDIARTAAARSSFLVAISSERDSGRSSSSSSSIIINDSSSSGSGSGSGSSSSSSYGSSSSSSSSSYGGGSIRIEFRRSNVRNSGSGRISKESIRGKGVTAIDKNKRERKSIGRSAVDVLHESNLSVRSYVTASSNRFDGTTRLELTPRYRPLAGKSRGSQQRSRPRQPQPQPPQQPLYYNPASWDTRTLHFRNC